MRRKVLLTWGAPSSGQHLRHSQLMRRCPCATTIGAGGRSGESARHTFAETLAAATDNLRDTVSALQSQVNASLAASSTRSGQGRLSTRCVKLRLCVEGDGAVDLQAQPAGRPDDAQCNPAWVSLSGVLGRQQASEGALASATNSPLSFGPFESTLARSIRVLLDTVVGPPSGAAQPVAADDAPRNVPIVARGPTAVLDMTRPLSDDVLGARRMLEARFPHLRLSFRHTSGFDIQNSRTHTFSVELRPSLEGGSLSEDERDALARFSGAAVGTGYHGTLRRALQEAFRAIGLTFPPNANVAGAFTCEGEASVSVLSVYAHILQAHGVEVRVRLTGSTVSVDAVCKDGAVLYTVSGEQRHSLSLLLTAAEAAAEKVEPSAASAARHRIANAALVLVLPDKGVRVKRVLRRLLNYYYGTAEESVDFHVTPSSAGVFCCSIAVPVPTIAATDTAPPAVAGVCTLSVASATTKKVAMRLAAALALREHFPRVYAEQLEFHPEVQALLASAPASPTGVCPPVSRGLKAVLEWAVEQEESLRHGTVTGAAEIDVKLSDIGGQADAIPAPKMTLSYSTRCVVVGDYTPDGRHRAVANVWATELSVSGSVLQDSHAYVRPLRLVAVDYKKARSDQKAMAAAIAQRYRHLCPEAVDYSVQQGLIEASGEPAGCAGVVTVSAAEVSEKGAADGAHQTDPFLRELRMTPQQPLTLPPLQRQSLLEALRSKARTTVSARGTGSTLPHDGPFALVERAVDAASGRGGVVTVQLCSVRVPHEDSGPCVVLAEASHRYKLCALFEAYKQLLGLQRPNLNSRGTATPGDSMDSHSPPSEADAARLGELMILEALPQSLPPEHPLETVCGILQTLYGAAVDLHMYADRKHMTVEMWGTVPAGSGTLSAGTETGTSNNYYFLAKAHGATPQEAALRCAYSAFEIHVRAHQGPFRGRRLPRMTAMLDISAAPNASLLARLTGGVVAEIAAGNGQQGESYAGEVVVHIRSGGSGTQAATARFEVVFSVVNDARRVELERAETDGLLRSIMELCSSIATETGTPMILEAPKGMHGSPMQRLQGMLTNLCGAQLAVEVVLADGEWHCRLSIPLGDSDTFYCVATATAGRKRDAVEAACQWALARHFPSTSGVSSNTRNFLVGEIAALADTSSGGASCREDAERGNFVYTLL